MESFDDNIEFGRQREFLGAWQPLRHYLIDWLIAIVYDIMDKASPYDYATRVAIGRDLMAGVNENFPTATQKTLLRVVRNLFPYDRIDDDVPESIQSFLEGEPGEGAELRRPDFLPLNDAVISAPDLIKERYDVLGEAFIRYATGGIADIERRANEDLIEPQMNIHKAVMEGVQPLILNLVESRSILYEDFPEEELSSVANETIAMRVEMPIRKDLPTGSEPSSLRHSAEKAEEVIRQQLAVIILRGKEVEQLVVDARARYLRQLSDILTMAATIHQYVGNEKFDEIDVKAHELRDTLAATFDVRRYLPADLCDDLKHGRRYFRDGWI